MKDKFAERYATWVFLNLAQVGVNWVEIVAQWVASVWVSSDSSTRLIQNDIEMITGRVLYLMSHPEEVWDGLLPGPPHGSSIDDFVLLTQDEYTSLKKAAGQLPVSKAPDDEYVVSIIIAPGVGHDETSDLLRDAWTENAESPLNLASIVLKHMKALDEMGKWIAEEMAAYITNSGHTWIMTHDQATAILKLENVSKELDTLAQTIDIDWDEQFQAIQDIMFIAGEDYDLNDKRQ